ncbi:hypothetical protein SD70_01410 [Gordoniibacillus kamchatkensis]|uniref:superoxide dismutase n=1 Tax=Gordoniibacillus kamchatkensis TaxID=1590651 RepID=A0ABR5AMY4_9BACL|nr:Fe-Mn family superoxide dismutase [Paenibacillus sp. VKM B-2647]KIL42233.1 hypothetical protein SD70_01410 [Paenibacillus sp. VKM B-2647]
MLRVYGTLMPIRVLEEIRFWKMQEREHTLVIRALAPDLEAPFAALLSEWESVFEQSEMAAGRMLEAAVHGGLVVSQPQHAEVSRLLTVSAVQSEQFIRHLMRMEGESAPIRSRPVVKTVLEHIIRESEYFLGVLQAGDPLLAPNQPLSYAPGAPARPAAPESAAVPEQPSPAVSPPAAPAAPAGGVAEAAAQGMTDTEAAEAVRESGSAEAARVAESAAEPAIGLAEREAATEGGLAETETAGPVRESGAAEAARMAESAADDAIITEEDDTRELAYLHVVPTSADAFFASGDFERVATGEGLWSLPDTPGHAPVPIGGHHLPPLPYGYDALEPHIDEATMRLHHDKHHRSYVEGLNRAEKKLAAAREAGDFALVKHWERELAFHGAGHNLHTLFWSAMSPKGGGRPNGALAAAIDGSFGSFEKFHSHFSEAANQVEGGGWALLVWCPRSWRLEILQAEKHQNLSQQDVVPLLPLDVWEHAYYVKYRNERAKYVAAWWNVVNWPFVEERFAKARQLRWPAY